MIRPLPKPRPAEPAVGEAPTAQGRASGNGAARMPTAASVSAAIRRRRQHDLPSPLADHRRGEGGDRGGAQGQDDPRRRPAEDDQRSGRRASWSNGRSCAATSRQRRFRPLHGLHRRQSELAGHRHAAPPRRGDVVVGPAATRASCAPSSQQVTSADHRPRASSRSPARCLLHGDRAGAQALVREAWRNDDFSGELESLALDVFSDLITPADHKARMDRRLYAEDVEGGAARGNRAGGNEPAIAKARIAVIKKARQRQGAARRGAGGGAPRHRLHLQPRPVAAPRRQGRRSRRS